MWGVLPKAPVIFLKGSIKGSCFSVLVFQPALDSLASLRIQHGDLLEVGMKIDT